MLIAASAVILDSFGIGKSSNTVAVEADIEQYGGLQIVTVCLIGPFVEEILYRGIVFGLLKGSGKNTVRCIIAVILTALFFGFNHCSHVNFSVYEMLANIQICFLGLALTALYWRTDNIICPMAVHIAFNCIVSL